jgi:UrcA family protein
MNMHNSPRSAPSMLFLALPLAVVFWIGLQSPARASGLDAQPPSVKVSFADLDLATPRGSSELLRRIRSAARVLCAELDDAAFDEKYLWHQCIAATVDSAVARVANDDFTAYYQTRTRATHAHRGAVSSATTARASR